MQNENQCVFLRGFRISIREGIFAIVFGGRIEISSVNDSTAKDMLGSRRGCAPIVGETKGWFGGGIQSEVSHPTSTLQTSAYFNSEPGEEIQSCVPDVVLDPIVTPSEVVPFVCRCCASINFLSAVLQSIPNYPKVSAG